jgi:hypothetical protein
MCTMESLCRKDIQELYALPAEDKERISYLLLFLPCTLRPKP